jgi:hypothetical protein
MRITANQIMASRKRMVDPGDQFLLFPAGTMMHVLS